MQKRIETFKTYTSAIHEFQYIPLPRPRHVIFYLTSTPLKIVQECHKVSVLWLPSPCPSSSVPQSHHQSTLCYLQINIAIPLRFTRSSYRPSHLITTTKHLHNTISLYTKTWQSTFCNLPHTANHVTHNKQSVLITTSLDLGAYRSPRPPRIYSLKSPRDKKKRRIT